MCKMKFKSFFYYQQFFITKSPLSWLFGRQKAFVCRRFCSSNERRIHRSNGGLYLFTLFVITIGCEFFQVFDLL